jgi:hypothetical protein
MGYLCKIISQRTHVIVNCLLSTVSSDIKNKSLLLCLAFIISIYATHAQGIGLPTKHYGIGFGNLKRFTGIRFNFADHNVEKVVGINTTVLLAKKDEWIAGDVIGISIGLLISIAENQKGVNLGGLMTLAMNNLSGLNIGSLGVGARDSVQGVNIAGGAVVGGSVRGVSIAGFWVRAVDKISGVTLVVFGPIFSENGDVRGVNMSLVGIGAKGTGSVKGFNFGGLLGLAAGGDITGINIGGLTVGSGKDITGFNFVGVGMWADGRVRGLNFSFAGIGAGESLQGITIAGLVAGSHSVGGLAIAPVIRGMKVKGIIIAPAWLTIGKRNSEDGVFTGLGVSAFNRIKGEQKGVTIGVVNYAKKIHGVQFGLLNIVKENPKGLRVLPFFNTRFGKKTG